MLKTVAVMIDGEQCLGERSEIMVAIENGFWRLSSSDVLTDICFIGSPWQASLALTPQLQ